MIKLESTVIINRPVQDVWDFVSDCTNEPQWHTDCISARATSARPLQTGSTQAWAMTYAKGAEANLTVTALEPGRLEQLETVSAPMNIKPTLTYTFEAAGTGTKFTRAMDVRPTGITRLMEPLLRRMMTKNNAGYVRTLKQVLDPTYATRRPGNHTTTITAAARTITQVAIEVRCMAETNASLAGSTMLASPRLNAPTSDSRAASAC